MPNARTIARHAGRCWRVMEVCAGRTTDVCVGWHVSYESAKRDAAHRNRWLLAVDLAEGRAPRLDVTYYPSHIRQRAAPWQRGHWLEEALQ